MSDTPRTDAAQESDDIWEIFQESCRLERELTAAHERIAVLEQVSEGGVKDAEDGRLFQWLIQNHLDNHVGSGEKFNLPDYGVLGYSFRRREWKDGKPYIAQEIRDAIRADMRKEKP